MHLSVQMFGSVSGVLDKRFVVRGGVITPVTAPEAPRASPVSAGAGKPVNSTCLQHACSPAERRSEPQVAALYVGSCVYVGVSGGEGGIGDSVLC